MPRPFLDHTVMFAVTFPGRTEKEVEHRAELARLALERRTSVREARITAFYPPFEDKT